MGAHHHWSGFYLTSLTTPSLHPVAPESHHNHDGATADHNIMTASRGLVNTRFTMKSHDYHNISDRGCNQITLI
jgi:hypothetical protein